MLFSSPFLCCVYLPPEWNWSTSSDLSVIFFCAANSRSTFYECEIFSCRASYLHSWKIELKHVILIHRCGHRISRLLRKLSHTHTHLNPSMMLSFKEVDRYWWQMCTIKSKYWNFPEWKNGNNSTQILMQCLSSQLATSAIHFVLEHSKGRAIDRAQEKLNVNFSALAISNVKMLHMYSNAELCSFVIII